MITLTKLLRNRWLPFLFAIPLFFSVYHYKGIVFDAVLYVSQYVHSIDPTRFKGDPAFVFGNQDSLGFFSPILGMFLELFGVSTGAFVYTLLMQLLWIVSAIFLVKSLLHRINRSIWILPVSILLIVFFAFGMEFSIIYFFRYVEVYACSRLLSIVLGICSLILLFQQRKKLCFLFICIGTVVHPLTAGWCLPFWMFYFFPKTRVPVLVASFLFPFSFLLHLGPLDILSSDWLPRPLDFRPDYCVISRFFLLLVFFMMQVKRSSSKEIKKISISLSLVGAISFYWDVWGGYGEHVFLYQVQPWRAAWLLSLIAVPLGICNVIETMRKISKGQCASTCDLGMILLVISFLSPRNLILVSLVAIFLIMKKNKVVSLYGWVGMFAASCLLGYLVQQYITWCLQGFPQIFGFNYMFLYPIRDSYLFFLFAFSIAFVMYYLKKRKILPASILILFVFFSQFMLLPFLALFLGFFPKENKLRYWGGVMVVILLTLFDGLIDVDARRVNLIAGMPQCFPWIFIAVVMSLTSIALSKKISYWGMAIWLSICSVVAVLNYSDSMVWQKKESQIDQYLHESIFPQIGERGKVLFFVTGEFGLEPRLRFLTGSYLSASSLVGSIFNRENYRLGHKRSLLIYQKNLNPQIDKLTPSVALNKLANVDTLIDRVDFLCGINEITHLATDKAPLPFTKEDSTLVNDSQKVYLYRCSLVE